MKLNHKLLPKHADTINVGFSSGVDSVAVAHFLKFKYRKNIRLIHYNHGMREQNDEMMEMAQHFAHVHNIPFSMRKRAKSDKTDEASLREDRINYFKSLGINHIVLCHHLNDAVESYLMNTFKGVPEHLPIKPISDLDDGLTVYRPFITETKREFEKYVTENWLEEFVVEDDTNFDIRHQRNFVRHCVLPMLDEREEINLETIVKKTYN